jgi:UDP-glucose 4-epimerase
MSRVLVTGANGLLGLSVCKLLVSEKYEVFGLVHREPAVKIPGVQYLLIDLETDWPTAALPKQLDTIIHLAQSEHFREFPEMAMNVFQVNIASTAKLLDYGRLVGIKRFVYASSGGVYGYGNQAFHEDEGIAAPSLLGYYLGSKLSGEVLVHSYSKVFQVNVLRFFFVYGARQKKSMLIPRLMDSILSHKPISLQGQDGIRINPVHVEDAALATRAALLSNCSALYNISGPEILTLRNIANSMGQYLNIQPDFVIQGDDVARDLIGDNSAMCQDLIVPTRKLYSHLDEVYNAIIS